MKPKIDTSRKASINVICGSSGSGKSAFVKQQIKTAKRLIVWDPDDEYQGIMRVTTISELVDWLSRYPAGPLKIRLVAQGEKMFNLWGRCVFNWGNCTAVAEELAGVTSPGKAPPGWHTLVSRGRKRGITIYAVMQRPAESDKTVTGNATMIRTGRLARHADAKYLAAEMDITPEAIKALPDLAFISKNMRTMELEAGKLDGEKRKVTAAELVA